MIQFKFTAQDVDAINAVKEKLHEALAGSPAYVSNEILLGDGDAANEIVLVVGNDSGEANVDIGIVFDNIEITKDTGDIIEGTVVEPSEEVTDDVETVQANGSESVEDEEFPACEECMIRPEE